MFNIYLKSILKKVKKTKKKTTSDVYKIRNCSVFSEQPSGLKEELFVLILPVCLQMHS